jgi:hypothetical protein
MAEGHEDRRPIRLMSRVRTVPSVTVGGRLAPAGDQHCRPALPPFGRTKTDALNEAVAVAKAQHQEAISQANRTFNATHTETKLKHRKAYMAARAAWDATKSTPDAIGYEEARQAFVNANAVADHTEARAELDRAIRAADAAYDAEVARLGQEHGVTVR